MQNIRKKYLKIINQILYHLLEQILIIGAQIY